MIKNAIKELEDLFGTKAKGSVIYFNDITYTPIPHDVAEAVKLIMAEYPELGYQLGMYSVKVFDQNVHPTNNPEVVVKNSLNKLLKSSLSSYFPVSQEEAKEIDEMEETFGNDRSELRSVLEDYFHLYDDYAKMSVQEFDEHLAEYFKNEGEEF